MRKGHQTIEFVELRQLETQTYDLRDYSSIIVAPDNNEESQILHYADLLLQAGCMDYHFTGREADRWHYLFDLADIRMNGDDLEEVAMTSTIDQLDSIPDELCVCRENVIIIAENDSCLRKCMDALEQYEE